MRCPNCQADLGRTILRGERGSLKAERCQQCGSFWFAKDGYRFVPYQEAKKVDAKAPSMGMKEQNFACPLDGELMEQWHSDDDDEWVRYWTCDKCGGSFFPPGQLLAIAKQRDKDQSLLAYRVGLSRRTQFTTALSLLIAGAAFFTAALRANEAALLAESSNPLPNVGPNLPTLILLAVTYLAGTVLAVLGKKLPIVLMGWGVIAVCLIGFVVVIFGP